MFVRVLLLCVAVLAVSLWPQGVMLCIDAGGRVELSPRGAPCCPGEVPGECSNCADHTAPDLGGASRVPVLEAPLAGRMMEVSDPADPQVPSGAELAGVASLPVVLEGVVLLI